QIAHTARPVLKESTGGRIAAIVGASCEFCGRPFQSWEQRADQFRESTSDEEGTVLFAVTLATLSVGSPNTSADCPRYYMLLFGGQSERFRPRTAHTWATYVKVTPNAPLEEFTISWLPASLNVRPLKLRAEPGVNVPLHRTLEMMANGN